MRPAAAAFPLLLLLLWITPATPDAETDAAPVKVTVFYETLCPDSRQFIVRQLYPVWSCLEDIMEVNLHAYGKAREDATGKFRCQHGSRECEANLMMTCAKKVTANDSCVLMEFTHCVMYRFGGVSVGMLCAEETGVEFNEVRECMMSREGAELQHQAGEEQSNLSPNLNYVPWILINDVFTSQQLEEAQRNLWHVVCEAYRGSKPKACLDSPFPIHHYKGHRCE